MRCKDCFRTCPKSHNSTTSPSRTRQRGAETGVRMKRWSVVAALVVASVGLLQGTAEAWSVSGVVLCDANGNGIADAGDLPLAGISIRIVAAGIDQTVVTDAGGAYFATLYDTDQTVSVTIGAT